MCSFLYAISYLLSTFNQILAGGLSVKGGLNLESGTLNMTNRFVNIFLLTS